MSGTVTSVGPVSPRPVRRGRRWLVAGIACGLAAGLVVSAGLWWLYRTSRPEYQLQRGQQALARADISEVERRADWLEAAGYPDQAHLLKGQLYLLLQRPNDAIREYNAIRHGNEEVLAQASVIFGLAFLAHDQPLRARRLLEWVVSARPDNVEARRGLAVVYYDQGAMDYAISQLERWSALDPADGQPQRFLGQIYNELEEPARAIEHYQAALDRKLAPPVREAVRVELAELLLGRHEFAQARELLEGVSGEAAVLRAECLYHLGRPAEAAQALAAVPDAPPSARRLRLQAQLKNDQGEPAAAVPLLEKALRVEPHDTASQQLLTQVYTRLGRPAEAAEQRRLLAASEKLWQSWRELKRKAHHRGNDAALRRQLAAVCERLGKPDWSQRWQRAAELCSDQENVPDD